MGFFPRFVCGEQLKKPNKHNMTMSHIQRSSFKCTTCKELGGLKCHFFEEKVYRSWSFMLHLVLYLFSKRYIYLLNNFCHHLNCSYEKKKYYMDWTETYESKMALFEIIWCAIDAFSSVSPSLHPRGPQLSYNKAFLLCSFQPDRFSLMCLYSWNYEGILQ